ncbi:MAG TPA: hypothetical protein VE863_05145 [Pyrinomonadaceae bacterium]|nr:hypothetical protein [Pyrinomonadaceae bacterium]
MKQLTALQAEYLDVDPHIINHSNPGPILGNITSPLFGQANQSSDAGGFGFSESANNRRFELQTRFTF